MPSATPAPRYQLRPCRLVSRPESGNPDGNYLDTTFLVFAAGYAGEDRAAGPLELLHLLRNQGAKLFCFSHTFDEIQGILTACAARIRRGELRFAYGPVIEHFIMKGLTSSDVDLLIARLPARLQTIGVRVETKPPYERHYSIDEQALEECLHREINYSNPDALVHDVDCISAVARLRRDRYSYSVERCHAVFITTNSALAKATRAFFHREAPEGVIPLAMTDFALGNLLWLKNPTLAPDLPKKRLIAQAYAAMDPPEGLWNHYLIEIAKLQESGDVTAEDYYLLRHSTSAKAALMDITKGETAAFSEGTVAEVLEVAKQNLRADLEEALAAKESKLNHTQQLLNLEKERSARRQERLQAVSMRVGSYVANAIVLVLVIMLAVALPYTFPWNLPSLRAGWWRYALAGAQLLLLVFTLAGLLWGTSISAMRDRFRSRLTAFVYRKLAHLYLGDDRGDVDGQRQMPPV